MKYIFAVLVTFQLFFSTASGKKGGSFSVSDIPDKLLSGAHVVVRLAEHDLTIEDIGSATYREHYVITILDESAKSYGYVYGIYDGLKKISEFNARVYDAKGKEIEKLKKSDIVDESFIGNASLFEDTRIKSADLTQNEYPYTIEYTLKYKYKYIYSLPDWVIQRNERVSCESTTYFVKAPKELVPRYKLINTVQEPEEQGDEVKTLRWSFQNLTAVHFEPYSRGYKDISPRIILAPVLFDFDGYKGSMDTWDAIAEWQLLLNEGTDDLPETTRKEIRQIAGNYKTTFEKVDAVYKYMQQKTRYVSIQLGIGGFKPLPASLVDANGYGDCKALVNYTQSLLAAVGITSHYSWVYGGDHPPDVDNDFPDDNFNHIILCIPNESDTIWLECTSQILPTGYLGDFTAGRKALVISEDGGKIVNTPSYNHNQNTIANTFEATLYESGSGEVHLKTAFIGQAYEYNNINYVIRKTEVDKKKWLRNYSPFSDFRIDEYSFEEKHERFPSMSLDLKLSVRNLSTTSSKRLLVNPNMFSQNGFVPPQIEERKSPVRITGDIRLIDSGTLTLPEHYFVEYLPESQEIKSEFGELKISITTAGEGQIIFHREFRLNEGVYKPSSYKGFREFLKDVRDADKKRIVLNSKT